MAGIRRFALAGACAAVVSYDSAPGVRHCIVVAVVVGTVWAQGALVAGGVRKKRQNENEP